MVERIAMFGGVIVVAAVVLTNAYATGRPSSVFEQLDALERRAQQNATEADQLRDGIDAVDAELTRRVDRARLAARAAEPVERRVHRTLIGWLDACAELDRSRGWAPGESDDADVLLRHATGSAIEGRLEDLEVVDQARTEAAAVDELLLRRGRMTVRLAQHESDEEAARTQRERTRKEGAADVGIADEIEHADEELHRSLSRMLENDTTEDFHRLKGTLLPPVTAAAKHTFGPHKQPGTAALVRHTGHTYRVDAGTPVRATHRGLVVYAQRFEGYGNTVIVDHGSGYHSIYAHLGEISVRQGADVDRGDRLGKSGESGSLDGPKLYFELRHDGKAIDPQDWFVQIEQKK